MARAAEIQNEGAGSINEVAEMAKIEVLEDRHVTRTVRRSETALKAGLNARGVVTYSPSQPRPIWARYAAEGAGI